MAEKILVVDDEPDVELLVTQQFRHEIRQGVYEFIFAYNGVQALELLKNNPDLGLIMTDINMPDMDGLTLLAKIKEIPRNIKVVVVSAYNDMGNIRTAMNRGAFDFLTKPIDFSDFEQTLSKTLEEVVFIKQAHKTREQLEIEKLERTRAEEREKMEQQFLANMSHEIRTPLNAVYGMTRLLQQKLDNEEHLKYVNGIRMSCENLIVIINDILDLSKVKAGRMEFENIPFKPAEIAQHLLDMLSIKADEKNIKLNCTLEASVPETLIGDPTRLSQVLINLVSNAIKFTEKGSVDIWIGGEYIDDKNFKLQCRVKDTGIGMKPDELQKVFDKFTQASTDITRRYGGTGLGLTISKKLVESQGGEIGVSSEFGKGSEFYFYITYVIGSNDNKKINHDPTEAQISKVNKLKILLAEDNHFNQLVAVGLIQSIAKEAKVDCAINGVDVLTMLEQKNYDVIIMDIQMPEMDGIEATRRIRAQGNNIPIVVMTAGVTPAELEAAMGAGANDFIAKPFEPGILIQKLADVVKIN
jgi:signal transduction histidine kinase